MKAIWPAPERNKQPIFEVLARVLPTHGTVLELASGSGQHVAHFAARLPTLTFLPSDLDDANLESIRAYRAEAGANFSAPLRIDVRATDWGVGQVEAIFNANMIHIAPFSACEGLFAGAGRHLARPGVMVLYGPFRVGGAHTAKSNEQFDRSLKAQCADWGVRDVEEVTRLSEAVGLRLDETVSMPANNLCLVFRRD